MADSELQKTTIFKKIFLKGVKQSSMTGDSIASRLSLEVSNSNRFYRAETNQYLYHSAISGSNLAYITINAPATWNPLSFIGRSSASSLDAINIKNIDLLIVWAGFNDNGDDVPLGAIDSTDPYTIAGAMRLGVQNYLVRKPSLKIMFVTPNSNPYQTTANGAGLNLIDYRNHIISVCQELALPCFDLWAVDGITEANKATAIPDQVHPSAAFLEVWAELIGEFVNNNNVTL